MVAGVVDDAEDAAGLFPKRPPAGAAGVEVVAVLGAAGVPVEAPPKRPPLEGGAGAEVVGVVDLLPNSDGPELVVVEAGVVWEVELALLPPKRPPEAGADDVAGGFAPKRPPEEAGCVLPAPNNPGPELDVAVAGWDEGAELAGATAGFAACPNRFELELWLDVLPNKPEPAGLELSVGGAPAGVVEPPRANTGFAGVADGAAVGVVDCPSELCVLLPKSPPPKILLGAGVVDVVELVWAWLVADWPPNNPPELGVVEPPPKREGVSFFSPELPAFPSNPPEAGAALVEGAPPPKTGGLGVAVVAPAALLPPNKPPPDEVGVVEAPAPPKRPPPAGLLAFWPKMPASPAGLSPPPLWFEFPNENLGGSLLFPNRPPEGAVAVGLLDEAPEELVFPKLNVMITATRVVKTVRFRGRCSPEGVNRSRMKREGCVARKPQTGTAVVES